MSLALVKFCTDQSQMITKDGKIIYLKLDKKVRDYTIDLIKVLGCEHIQIENGKIFILKNDQPVVIYVDRDYNSILLYLPFVYYQGLFYHIFENIICIFNLKGFSESSKKELGIALNITTQELFGNLDKSIEMIKIYNS
jgi:hypothetical protein